jgi:hypothetical protein
VLGISNLQWDRQVLGEWNHFFFSQVWQNYLFVRKFKSEILKQKYKVRFSLSIAFIK